MTTEISLKQVPVIQYKQELVKIGKSIDERLKGLNLEGQVATIETLKSLKELRADLNKELKEYESQRTGVKKAILKEYDEFETEYKKEIKEKIEKAVETLKDKIDFVEDDLRKKKEDTIKDYFKELCETKKIDFLTFDQTEISINLSTPDKQYKEKCIEFINKVVDDLELIDTQDYKTEILFEYKTSLNAARSIKIVKERKAALEKENKKEKQEQLNKRIQIVLGLGFIFNENTANYEKGEDFISYELVENLSTESFKQWAEKYIIQEPSFPENVIEHENDVVFVDAPVFSTPKILIENYEIRGTSTQIVNLQKYMKENNIIFLVKQINYEHN